MDAVVVAGKPLRLRKVKPSYIIKQIVYSLEAAVSSMEEHGDGMTDAERALIVPFAKKLLRLAKPRVPQVEA